jgi:hypothetical protein
MMRTTTQRWRRRLATGATAEVAEPPRVFEFSEFLTKLLGLEDGGVLSASCDVLHGLRNLGLGRSVIAAVNSDLVQIDHGAVLWPAARLAAER